ncbi:MAG: phytoene desaturase family protein [Polyangiaceae bacterium]
MIVVGAGLGGLASAVRLAHAGFDVHVVEKDGGPGGRCSSIVDSGFTWDVGPTMLLFPQVLRDLFDDVGERAEDWLDLSACSPNYRIHFPDGASLTMSSDLRAMEREFEAMAEGSFAGLRRVLALGERQKEIAFSTFLARTYDRPSQMFGAKELVGIVRSKAYRSLHAVVSRHVADPRLRMALTFQTMYLGLSPFEGPALFGLLPYTEIVDGIWYARGGLSAIATALAELARKKGATITYGRSVRAIERSGPRTRGVLVDDGTFVPADAVLANADWPYVERVLLGRPAVRRKFTSSAFVVLLGCGKRWDTVLHHNVFFGDDYASSFDAIFREGRIPRSPSFYVANPVRSDPSVAPEGGSALYVLVPVPHLPDDRAPRVGDAEFDWSDANRVRALRDEVVRRVERTIAPGLSDSLRVERWVTPLDWNARFSLEHGSAFGLAHTLDQVGAFRPSNRDRELENLYFVGASTQPATGIPNVLVGAKHVAERIGRELHA